MGRRAREHLATDSFRSIFPLRLSQPEIVKSYPRKIQYQHATTTACLWTKTSINTNNWSSYVGRKGEQMRGYKQRTKKKHRGKFGGNFRRPPLVEFGADAARYFADHTTGVGGTGVRLRRAR